MEGMIQMPGKKKKKQLKTGMAQQSRAHGEAKAEEPCQTPNMNWTAEGGNMPMLTKHLFVIWLRTRCDWASKYYRKLSSSLARTSAPAHTPDGVHANARTNPCWSLHYRTS